MISTHGVKTLHKLVEFCPGIRHPMGSTKCLEAGEKEWGEPGMSDTLQAGVDRGRQASPLGGQETVPVTEPQSQELGLEYKPDLWRSSSVGSGLFPQSGLRKLCCTAWPSTRCCPGSKAVQRVRLWKTQLTLWVHPAGPFSLSTALF